MYKLMLNLPFDVVVVSRQEYPTREVASRSATHLGLPAGFEVVEEKDVPKNAIVLPLGKEQK